ncbi:tetratricopeptide repeat protein [Kordiimonas sp.]|uniref:tetratricopeptide repeat protein n=1 Tax=Kordiimonas sp. TaxID=1970157 RepID=UPI003A8D44F8
MRKKIANTMVSGALILLTACASGGPSKRATEDVGPVSVRARNSLATENPAGLVKVGEGFERAGNYAAAQALYQQALAAAPDLMAANVAVARILTPMGRPEESLRLLQALVEESPEATEARSALVDAYIANADYKSALQTFQPLITSASSAEVYDTAGRLAYISGAPDGARIFFDKALKLEPENPSVLQHLALSYALDGAFESAVALIQKAMDRPSAQLPAQRSLAIIYALSGQTDAAMHIARGAMPLEEANNMRVFYQLLPKLQGEERAAAAMFGRIPTNAIEKLNGK